jgi:hypothetical protein
VVFDIINVPRILSKLRINFQISTFLKSGLTPGFSIASSKASKRTLEVPERSLGGF